MGEQSSGNPFSLWTVTRHTSTNQFDGIKLFPSSGTFTGTIRVYGLKNG
jgi:hypothetical protein